MSVHSLTAEDQELRRQLIAEADDHGNAVIEVDGDEHGAPYCFTVGAWRRFGVAEAVAIGLPDQLGRMLVDSYVGRAADGERFFPGKLYEDFFDGVPVTLERVAKPFYPEFFGTAFLLYPTGEFPAIQLIVPTPQGNWPWDVDAPPGFGKWQPVLTESGRPESWTAGVDGP